jgi:hypothetical protein
MTPTHTGLGFGWIVRPAFHRSLWKVLALVLAVGVSALLLIAPSSSTGCLTLAQATRGPELRVTALPGVDLRPALSAAGLTAASGPYPGVASALQRDGAEVATWIEGRPRRAAAVDRPLLLDGSWPRRGEIALDAGVARRLGYRSGARIGVATAHGVVKMPVAGITATTSVERAAGVPGLAYVLPRDLRTVAPPPVHSSTVLLQTSGARTRTLAHALDGQFPGPQAVVATGFVHRCLSA